MNSKARLLVLSLAVLGGCQRDINHHPARIAVTSLVSLGDKGQQGNGASSTTSVTPDGHYVAFISASTNLVSGAAVSHLQVYRRDLVSGSTILISLNDLGQPGNDDSLSPSISGDGLRVAFRSVATNLSVDSNPNPNVPDVYVRDLSVNPPVTLLLSGADGGGPNDSLVSGSSGPSISQDGKFVAFMSDATTLVSPPLPMIFATHAFRRSIDGLTTEMVDLQPDGSPSGTASMFGVSISANGRYVAFDSSATDLGNPNLSGSSWVYIRDMSKAVGAVELVSVSLDPTVVVSGMNSVAPSISSDGRVVAFHSTVPNLVPDDTNGTTVDVFVRDLRNPLSPRTLLISRHSSGAVGSADSTLPMISGDGRFVVFLSIAINLVDGDFNNAPDVFWHDLDSGRTVRISVNTDQQEGLGDASAGFSITGDGRFVFFVDHASNLVTDDVNGVDDVFLRGPLY